MIENPLVELVIPGLGIALAFVCAAWSVRSGGKRRLVDNLPTSRTTGVFIGLVEIQGTAEVERPLTAYMTGEPCVGYRWVVEEHWSRTVRETYQDDHGQTRTRTRRESGWATVADGGEEIPFYLRDDCGVILIQPEGASVEALELLDETCDPSHELYYGRGPDGSVSDSDHRRRFREHAIPLHAPIYVMGRARERHDIVAAEIAADKSAPMFLISTRSEEEISRDFGGALLWVGLLGLPLAVGGIVCRELSLNPDPWTGVPLFLAAAAGYGLAWGTGWVWMVYNSMVDLRERVRQGWSNVDVQLKRRHDLIPALVAIVTGLRDYERAVMVELAALRAQMAVTPPGEPGADPAGCLPAIRAIVEAYPDLKSDKSFLNLQKQLVDTEQRIALARGYFNDVATFYNTRLDVIPDRFVAALGGMRPRPLLEASGFERASVNVTLAE